MYYFNFLTSYQQFDFLEEECNFALELGFSTKKCNNVAIDTIWTVKSGFTFSWFLKKYAIDR